VSPQNKAQLRREAQLIGRVADVFAGRFAELVQRLNRPATHADPAATADTLRLCVEAVNMLLDTQTRLARSIERVCDDTPPATYVLPPAHRRAA
jgi:hypothetical protein